MNSQSSRKIIVAGGLAAVVVIGGVTFALRSHPVTPVAQTFQAPSPSAQIPDTPAAVAQIPDAPAAVAQIPDAPAAVAQIPDVSTAIAHKDNVGTKSADVATPSVVEPKLARNRNLAKASTSDAASNSAATKPVAKTVANSVDQGKSADQLTTPSASGSLPTDDQKAGTSTEFAASDNQITTDVKAEIAGDSLSKGANIGVITTHGVVVLTGSLTSQDAIDHVKVVAGKVKDVKSVDTSALILASL